MENKIHYFVPATEKSHHSLHGYQDLVKEVDDALK